MGLEHPFSEIGVTVHSLKGISGPSSFGVGDITILLRRAQRSYKKNVTKCLFYKQPDLIGV